MNRNQGGRRAAAYELAGAGEELEALHSRIRMELVGAYNELSSAYLEAIELKNNVLGGAETVFEASRSSYNRGKLDYINVLDAQRTMYEARARYIDVLVSYHLAKADVERLTGRSLDGEGLE
jgi:cobalt-zinc-cadmium efflux system outer membrane protein